EGALELRAIVYDNLLELYAPAFSAKFEATLDLTGPSAATIELVTDSGADDDDAVTKDASLTISPVAEGVTRVIKVNGVEVDGDYVAPAKDGDYEVEVIDTDVAGNSTTTSLKVTLD